MEFFSFLQIINMYYKRKRFNLQCESAKKMATESSSSTTMTLAMHVVTKYTCTDHHVYRQNKCIMQPIIISTTTAVVQTYCQGHCFFFVSVFFLDVNKVT